jgi:hypothetical protein
MCEFFAGARNAILVLFVFVLLLLFAHHSSGVASEAKFADYCLSKSGEAFAAFLGLITGHALAVNGNGKLNGNGGPPPVPDPTSAPKGAPGETK